MDDLTSFDALTNRSNGHRGGSSLKAMKFGGTSVGSPEHMSRVVEIVKAAAAENRLVVIASALSGVTRQLVAAIDDLVAGTLSPERAVEAMRTRHEEQAEAVLSDEAEDRYERVLSEELEALHEVFGQIADGSPTPALRDRVLAAGELCSVPMLAEALRDAGLQPAYGNATRLVRTDDTFGGARVDQAATRRLIQEWHDEQPAEAVALLAGYIGATEGGQVTTLGFEGSDYSAALVASILGASVLERWTDVDGLYTDDPRTHGDAQRIETITMAEAVQRNEDGGLGMHPKALRPLYEARIPAHIRCTTAPEGKGTRVLPEGDFDGDAEHNQPMREAVEEKETSPS